jgi:hypothetical protein
MKIWGIHKKYKSLSWCENFLSGHISIGRLTIYGKNAMNWTVNFSTKKWGYICFTLPFRSNWKRMYFYLSPNGTPWAATYYRGNNSVSEKRYAKIRKKIFGHGFDSNKYHDELYDLNNNGQSSNTYKQFIREQKLKNILNEK